MIESSINESKAILNTTKIKCSHNDDVLDHRFLNKFRKDMQKLSKVKSCSIHIKKIRFWNISSLVYFESLIYLHCKQNSNGLIITYDIVEDELCNFETSILASFISPIDKKIIVTSKEFCEVFDKNKNYTKTESIESIRIRTGSDVKMSDIFKYCSVVDFFPADLLTGIKSIISEFINNASNHDRKNYELILSFKKMPLAGKESMIELSLINFCSKNIISEFEQNEKYKDVIQYIKDSRYDTHNLLLPFLFIEGVSTRKNKKFGGTGLHAIHKKIYEKQYEEAEFLQRNSITYLVCENMQFDLSKAETYKSLNSYLENLSKNNEYVTKENNYFKGLIYNAALLSKGEK